MLILNETPPNIAIIVRQLGLIEDPHNSVVIDLFSGHIGIATFVSFLKQKWIPFCLFTIGPNAN
jgi:hypothetical protein